MSAPNTPGGNGGREPDFRPGPDPNFRQDEHTGFGPDAEVERTPRRGRQPVLAVLAIIGIVLLVLAVGIFGGIF